MWGHPCMSQLTSREAGTWADGPRTTVGLLRWPWAAEDEEAMAQKGTHTHTKFPNEPTTQFVVHLGKIVTSCFVVRGLPQTTNQFVPLFWPIPSRDIETFLVLVCVNEK